MSLGHEGPVEICVCGQPRGELVSIGLCEEACLRNLRGVFWLARYSGWARESVAYVHKLSTIGVSLLVDPRALVSAQDLVTQHNEEEEGHIPRV